MNIRIITTLLIFCGFCAQAQAIDYYVSESAGSDTNTGLSSASAFQTLDRINALSLLPGDRVLFKSGDTWNGMFWPKGSGNSAAAISIDSYGGDIKPIIDGDGYQAAILIFNQDYYDIKNLQINNQSSHLDTSNNTKLLAGFGGSENNEGSGRDVRFGIKIVASTRSLTYFRISAMDIHDIYPTPIASHLKHQGYGIKFESQSNVAANAIYTISDVEIDSVTVSKTGHYGIWVRPLGLNNNDQHKHFDFTLRNSQFLNTGGSGFVPVKVSGVLVENNYFDGTGSSIDSRMWARGSGLWPFDSKDVVIQHNTVKNARGPLDSYGIHIDYNNENVVVQYNFSYNNEGGFVQILGANINSGYRYNISVADGSRVQGVNNALQNGRIFNVSNFCNVNSGCPSTGNFIYNNTVFVPNSISPEIFFKAGSGETLFKNNLVFVEEGSTPLSTQLAQQGVTYHISNNLFYPATLFSLAQQLTSNAIYDDPNLVLAGAEIPAAYKLALISPAKFAGASILTSSDPLAYSENNGGEDFFGNSVSIVEAPHIGAYSGNEISVELEIPLMLFPYALLLGLILIVIAIRYTNI